jgi:PAS domain S-box-containing protein
VLVASYGLLFRVLERSRTLGRQVLLGLFFGLFAVSCMHVKIPVHEGVIVDQRNAMVVLSGAFGGPLSAVVSAAMAGLYRYHLGGGGVFAGAVGVCLSALAGIGVYQLRNRIDTLPKAFVAALVATIIILPGFLFVGDFHTGWELTKRMTLPYGSAILTGMFLVGLLLAHEEHRHAQIAERMQAEETRRRKTERWQLEAKAISAIAGSANLAEGAVTELAKELTEAVTGAIGADRAGIWLLEDEGNRLNNIDTYQAAEKQHISGAAFQKHEHHKEFAALMGATYVDVYDALNDPRTAPFVEDYLQPNQIASILAAVIRSGSRPFGILCLEHVGNTHQWEEDEIAFACQLADQLALAISNRDRKRAEEYQSRLISAIEQSGEMLIITDGGGVIEYVNPMFERVSGYTREEVLGKNPRILKSGKHDRIFYKELWDVLLQGETWTGRITNRKKDGALYTVEAVISPVHDETGGTVNYIATNRDITNALQLEKQLQQAQKVESIGRLAGGVAHDLNNLLTPIIGYGEMLRDHLSGSETQLKYLGQMLSAGFKARDLVRQLLAFSRSQTLEFKPLDLNQVVTGFEKLLRRTIPEDVEMKLVLSPNVRSIMGDIGQIEQVIMNLAVNASDAMPNGGVLLLETATVRIDEAYAKTGQWVEPGEYVLLSMSDTGLGMEQSIREHIFEPFFSTKGELGTGLGLATVYGIVKQHAGNIWVYSEPGKGTVFKIYLPVSTREAASSGNGKKAPTELKGYEHILLVEDNDQVRYLANSILSAQGYHVLAARDGHEALTILGANHHTVHLLLTDVVMPKMNGRELFAKMAAINPHLKVLYMSGYTANIIAHRGVLHEGVQFIQKPFTAKGLAAKVREVLDSELPSTASQ